MNYSGLSNKHYKHKNKKINIYGENIDTKSSFISHFCYHPLSGILEIFFHSERNYVYFKVPPEVFSEFAAAKSTGRAFHSLIKGKFEERLLDG